MMIEGDWEKERTKDRRSSKRGAKGETSKEAYYTMKTRQRKGSDDKNKEEKGVESKKRVRITQGVSGSESNKE